MDAPSNKPWQRPKAKSGTESQTGPGGPVKWGQVAREGYKPTTMDDHAAGPKPKPAVSKDARSGPPVKKKAVAPMPKPEPATGKKPPMAKGVAKKAASKGVPPWLKKKAQ